MPICSPAQNTPVPAGYIPIGDAGIAVTPKLRAFAAKFAYDGSVPQNSMHTAWIDGHPIGAWVNCHTYTEINGESIPGAYHGASLFLVTDPSLYPPPGGERIDWPMVAVTGGAIAGVVTLFVLALRHAGRARYAGLRR